MDAQREFIDIGTFAAQVENSNLGIRYTAVESGLGVWLNAEFR